MVSINIYKTNVGGKNSEGLITLHGHHFIVFCWVELGWVEVFLVNVGIYPNLKIAHLSNFTQSQLSR